MAPYEQAKVQDYRALLGQNLWGGVWGGDSSVSIFNWGIGRPLDLALVPPRSQVWRAPTASVPQGSGFEARVVSQP